MTVGGSVYTLRPTFNALCALDELTGKSLDDMFGAIRTGRMSGLRSVVWCLLQPVHGDAIKTLEDAGNWIEEAGVDEVMAAVAKCVLTNAPDTPGDTGGNPPNAQGGTGEAATTADAVPV